MVNGIFNGRKNMKGGPLRLSEVDLSMMLTGYIRPAMHANLRRLDQERKKRKRWP